MPFPQVAEEFHPKNLCPWEPIPVEFLLDRLLVEIRSDRPQILRLPGQCYQQCATARSERWKFWLAACLSQKLFWH